MLSNAIARTSGRAFRIAQPSWDIVFGAYTIFTLLAIGFLVVPLRAAILDGDCAFSA
jgi:hypothetical protein